MADEPPPPAFSFQPSDGLSVEQSYVRAVQFEVVSPLHGAFFRVRLATSSQLGQTAS